MGEKMNGLVKAELTDLGSMETVTVDWNPRKYSLAKKNQLAPAGMQAATPGGCEERFSTELFLDSTRRPLDERNLREVAEKLEGWMDPQSPGGPPAKVVFLWGPFRFTGYIDQIEEEWVRFDPDGTPVRGLVRLEMRG
ncbi:MAG: hypothetical protein VX254_00510 [Planctomycetota bacterium]|nr:hypothetical protein [Planctomycetota bacterium]